MRRVAMVSSTVLDLPEHREQVKEACIRAGFFPKMQEYGSAASGTAVEVSLGWVEEADVYIGVLGTRYGYVPAGEERSVTELEYQHAVRLRKKRLLFLMPLDQYESHYRNVEFDAVKKARLDALRAQMETDRVAGYFKDPADLFNHVVTSLNELASGVAPELHAVTDAPAPPEAYVAHPYTLLQTKDLVGRQTEQKLLTEWVTRTDLDMSAARVLVIEAVGGMGKSALTWHWFTRVAPHEMRPLAGRVWWSFYETDATYENFLTRTLAYVSRRRFSEVEQLPLPDREEQLLRVLDKKPYLIVLDGLERLLQAYGRPSAAQSVDSELDRQASEYGEGTAVGADPSTALGQQHRLRRTINPRAGTFLRRLVTLGATRVLVSTRLFPTELQTDVDTVLPGAWRQVLAGLSDSDAVDLWRSFGVTGASGELLELFHAFANYPLLIRVLAGEVARFRPAPRDFQAWRAHHQDFNPFNLELLQVRSHVLTFALSGLTGEQGQLLNTIAAFSAPVSYGLLREMVVGPERPYSDDVGLDHALEELEDRGLVGWDRSNNRYDEHPIVRGVAWTALDPRSKRTIHEAFERYFASLPASNAGAQSLDELYGPLQHFSSLCELGRYDEALQLYVDRISDPLAELGEWAVMVEHLTELLEPGTGFVRGADGENTIMVYLLMALALQLTGQPERAIPFWRKLIAFGTGDAEVVSIGLALLSHALVVRGQLPEAEAAAERSLELMGTMSDTSAADRSIPQAALGAVRAVMGTYEEAIPLLEEAGAEDDELFSETLLISSWLCRALDWQGDRERAGAVAERAWQRAQGPGPPARKAEAAALKGALALESGDLDTADDWLRQALDGAAAGGAVPVEVNARLSYVELERRRGNAESARLLLVDAVELAKRAPFAQALADAEYLRALIEHDLGRQEAAVAAGIESIRLAHGSGPPYVYAFAVARARALLEALGGQIPPDLPAMSPRLGPDLDQRIVDEEWDELVRGLDSDEARTRRNVVTMVASVSNAPARVIMRQALADPALEVRLAALEGLRPRDERRVPVMLGDLLDPDSGETFPREIIALAADPDPEIRAAAITTAASTVKSARSAVFGPSSLELGSDGGRLEHVLDEITRLWLPADLVVRTGDDANAAVRAAAAPALGLVASPAARTRLIELVRDEQPYVRVAAVSVLPAGDEQFGPILGTALLDESPSVRAAAAARLKENVAEFGPELIGCLSDSSAEVRRAVVEGFPYGGGDELEEAVCALVDDPDPAVVRALANTIRHWSTPRRVEARLRLLEHGDAIVRAETLSGAAFSMSDAFVEPVIRRFSDIPSYARPTAVGAIGGCHGAGIHEFLAGRLEDADPKVRAAAVEAIGRRRDVALLANVLAVVDDPSEAAAEALGVALTEFGDLVSRETVRELLASERAMVRRAAAAAIGNLGRHGDEAALLLLLADPDAGVRLAAARSLSQLGVRAGSDAVLTSLHAESTEVRAMAVAAVAELGLSDAREQILLLAADPQQSVRQAVLEAMLTLAPDRTTAVQALFVHGDARMRGFALTRLRSDLDPIERTILSRDLDGRSSFIILDAPTVRAQIERAARRLALSPSEIEQRLESLANRLRLPVELLAPAPVVTSNEQA